MSDYHSPSLHRMAKQGDYERYLCALMSGLEKSDALMAVIAFNDILAKIKETTTDPVTAEMRLLWWREAVEDLFNGKARKHPFLQAALSVIRAGALQRKILMDLVEARFHDFMMNTPTSFATLCKDREVFVTPFAIACLKAIGLSANEKRAAVTVMLNYDLAGLFRNIPFDFSRQRCWVPQDILKKCGTTSEQLMVSRKDENNRKALVMFGEKIMTSFMPVPASGFFLLHQVLALRHMTRAKAYNYDPDRMTYRSGRLGLYLSLWRAKHEA